MALADEPRRARKSVRRQTRTEVLVVLVMSSSADGIARQTPAISDYDEDARERLLAKLDRAVARLGRPRQASP